MINFLNLEYFLVAAEELNFTKAAKKLFISQQSLSNHISNMEKEFDVILFNRTTPLTLTYAGQALKEKAKQMQRYYENVILVCGHYEGIDQRFIDECVDEEISLGDFVLTGGELPAMMIADAVCRLVPGVLGDEVCFTDESHWDGLLEYPQYSRPEEWHGLTVPEVLLSGNHEKVDRWRKKQAILRTMELRPDMFQKLRFPYKTRAERKFIAELEAENEQFRSRDPKNLDYRK